MTEKLSDQFERSRSRSVTWEGRLVFSMYELSRVKSQTYLHIDFDDQSPARPQGLRLKVRNGTINVAGQELTDVVLWSDTAPKSVTAVVKGPRGSANLRFWNCWRDPAGSVQAWIGNAGMLVEETPKGIVLRCSDGFDDVTFSDLVATIQIVSADGIVPRPT